MFSLINKNHKKQIEQIVKNIHSSNINDSAKEICKLINTIKDDIPIKKRISYGRYSIIKNMGLAMYPLLLNNDIDPYPFSLALYEDIEFDPFVRSLGIQILSI